MAERRYIVVSRDQELKPNTVYRETISVEEVDTPVIEKCTFWRQDPDFPSDPKFLYDLTCASTNAVHYLNQISLAPHLYDVVTPTLNEFIQGEPIRIVTEEIPGKSLQEELTRRKMEPQEAITKVGQLLLKIAEIHDHHVIHRDLKPTNIIITPSDDVTPIDFGFATLDREAQIQQSSEYLVGTPIYAAPERWNLRTAKALIPEDADIYALAMVLAEICTRTSIADLIKSWPSEQKVKYLRSTARAEMLIGQLALKYSSEFVNIMSKAIGPYENRYKNARDFHADLMSCVRIRK